MICSTEIIPHRSKIFLNSGTGDKYILFLDSEPFIENNSMSYVFKFENILAWHNNLAEEDEQYKEKILSNKKHISINLDMLYNTGGYFEIFNPYKHLKNFKTKNIFSDSLLRIKKTIEILTGIEFNSNAYFKLKEFNKIYSLENFEKYEPYLINLIYEKNNKTETDIFTLQYLSLESVGLKIISYKEMLIEKQRIENENHIN